MDSSTPYYLQIGIVVFREILEIALILGILTSATKEVAGRARAIVSGLLFGIGFAIILAIFTDKISMALDGMGQEFFNGLILLSASFMIAWTVLWMQKHARSLSGELKRLGNSVKDGKKPLYALTIVVLLSVIREGAEIVLFSYSYFVSGVKIYQILTGIIAGAFCGILLGLALYFGLLKTFGKYFFQISSWLLIFFASSTASLGIRFWSDAQIIDPILDPFFDSSQILSQSSFLGKVLHIIFGYIDQPSLAQFITYFTVLIGLAVGLKIAKKI
ncbi:MAG: FTR1 family iron permease [Rickettsiales bacterium]